MAEVLNLNLAECLALGMDLQKEMKEIIGKMKFYRTKVAREILFAGVDSKVQESAMNEVISTAEATCLWSDENPVVTIHSPEETNNPATNKGHIQLMSAMSSPSKVVPTPLITGSKFVNIPLGTTPVQLNVSSSRSTITSSEASTLQKVCNR
ncbi:hypothetical protein CHUAL_009583 [Chamberlinius hualienensis]